MSSNIPITLRGNNLGARHRYLNYLVSEAYDVKEPVEKIIALPESSPIDRIFKINLALKHKNVEFILKNLQDDDMLYVCRALKSKWLLDEEYRCYLNPSNLEKNLYPHMITTAVNKMKYWIHLNLRDLVRCQEFYEYYLEKDIDYAFKFLCKCHEEIILKALSKPEILAIMTPQRLKILCERTSTVAKMFFEMLTNNKVLLKKYVANDYQYINSLKCLLKTDADTYLNIIEEHFASHFKRLSTIATKFIITQRKDRFMLKPELYIARILNVNTLAQCLTQEECEELVIKLARAQYLESKEYWFNYKNVEPFVKRLDIKKRGKIKKKIFVDKDFGELVEDWSYSLPASLSNLLESDAIDVFSDKELSPADYDFGKPPEGRLFGITAANCGIGLFNTQRQPKMYIPLKPNLFIPQVPNMFLSHQSNMFKSKTLLDYLFDEYRVSSFDKTLFELRNRIASESSSQNRMYMMLVLVSKSGGKVANLCALFKLIMDHRNEPSQVRAAIIRSLVNRACVWRVTDDIWKDLLIFGRGLGLDGNTPEADCIEGLHAVMIRTLLSNRDCDPAIKSEFIKNLYPLTSYSLTTAEKKRISESLLKILIESANAEVDAYCAAQILRYALDTLQAFKIKYDTRPEVIACVKNLVRKDKLAASGILKQLYDSKFWRKELFRENFNLIQTDSSYLNALKHDITILSVDKFLSAVLYDPLNLEQFLRKLSVYFSDNEGLASSFLAALLGTKIQKKLGKPIAYLIGNNLKSYILELDCRDIEAKRFSAIIRANAHLTRPAFSINSLGLHTSGAKLIANKVLKCKAVDIDRNIKELLTWKRTARLAIVLAQRTNSEADVFASVAKLRPTVALKTAATYYGRNGDRSDILIWEIVKPLLVKVKDSITKSHHLMLKIRKVDLIPICIRSEYATEVFKVINEVHFEPAMYVLCHIYLLLPNIVEFFIEAVLSDYIKNKFVPDSKIYDYRHSMISTLYLKILGKYLLLCKTEEIQNRRFKKIGQIYLDRLQSYWESTENKTMFFKYLTDIIQSLNYNEAFINEEYVSCQPLLEKIDKWMQGFLPMDKHFSVYVPLHLTMLYYKAIRQANQQMPRMLPDKQRRCNEGHKIVGEIFGKYVGLEARVLIKKYFDSITVFYAMDLLGWIHNNFNNGRYRMILYIIRGIIQVSEGVESTVALPLFNYNAEHLNDEEKEDICNVFKQMNQIEMQFCYNDYIIPDSATNAQFTEFPEDKTMTDPFSSASWFQKYEKNTRL